MQDPDEPGEETYSWSQAQNIDVKKGDVLHLKDLTAPMHWQVVISGGKATDAATHAGDNVLQKPPSRHFKFNRETAREYFRAYWDDQYNPNTGEGPDGYTDFDRWLTERARILIYKRPGN